MLLELSPLPDGCVLPGDVGLSSVESLWWTQTVSLSLLAQFLKLRTASPRLTICCRMKCNDSHLMVCEVCDAWAVSSSIYHKILSPRLARLRYAHGVQRGSFCNALKGEYTSEATFPDVQPWLEPGPYSAP